MEPLEKLLKIITRKPEGEPPSRESVNDLMDVMAETGKSFVLKYGPKKGAPVWICKWRFGKKRFMGYHASDRMIAFQNVLDAAVHYVRKLHERRVREREKRKRK